MNLEDQINILRQRQEKARQIKAKADAQRETAQDNITKIVHRLESNYGVSTLKQAQELAISMEKDLQEVINGISSKLDLFD